MSKKLMTTAFATAVVFTTPGWGEEQEDLEGFYGDEETVSLAAGYDQSVRDAPATATVITAEELRTKGVRTVGEALRTVAGVHQRETFAFLSLPIIRGFFSPTNGALLVMFNGTPTGRTLSGTFNHFDRLLIDDIDRIEIVRGPGSALYGADAESGVINIITRTAAGIDETETGTRLGTNGTVDAWVLHGQNVGPVDVAFSAVLRSTDGDGQLLAADTQTVLDQLVGTNASLAPGGIDNDGQLANIRLDLSMGPLTIRGNFNAFSAGLGAGLVGALDPGGRFRWKEYVLEGLYEEQATEHLKVKGKVGFWRTERRIKTTFLPAGTLGVFPEGVQQNNIFSDDQFQTEITGLYDGFEKQVLQAGAGFYLQELNDLLDRRNYTIVPGIGPVPTPFGTPEQLGVATSLPPFSRTVVYGFIQDEWRVASDVTVTAGVRVDRFDDVGTQIAPRAGIVWNATPSLTAKFLYGRGFRTPSYIEAVTQNNLINIGNPNLDSESLDSVEVALERRGAKSKQSVSLYGYRVQDRIALTRDPAQGNALVANNADEDLFGYGLELSGEVEISKAVTLRGNYTYQRTVEKATDDSLGIAPRHQIHAEGDWRFAPRWQANINVEGVFDQERQPADNRPPVDDYVVFNAFLERRDVVDGLDVSLGVRNIFDEDVVQPSFSNASGPVDTPLAGRQLFLQVRARF